MTNKVQATFRASFTLALSSAMAVDTIINYVKLRNSERNAQEAIEEAVGRVKKQNRLTKFKMKTRRLYEKLTNNLATKVPILSRYIELISI